MPLYQVTTHHDLLDDRLRERLVEEITRIHTSHTDAPELFVNVLFQDLPDGRLFTAGKPSRSTLITGQIRDGRDLSVRQAMLREIHDMWVREVGQSEDEILVGLVEINSRTVMEAGLILPAAGDEDAWFEEHQDRLTELGLAND